MIRSKDIWTDINIRDGKAFLLRDLLRNRLKRILIRVITLLIILMGVSIGVRFCTPEINANLIVHAED
jgi:hypothetical protein